MRRQAAAGLIVSIVLAVGLSAWPVVAQTTTTCQLAPVFMMLRDLVGRDRVGECVSAVVQGDGGDLNQPTTRGVLTFRPHDLVAAFSEGQTTWLYGPNGLESRPSHTRLAWETTTSVVSNAATGSGTTTTSGVGTTAASQSVAGPVVSASPMPVALATLPIQLEGENPTTTRAFDLGGGEYLVAWNAERQRGKTSCYVGSRLRRFEDRNPGALVLHATLNTSGDRSVGGETRLFSVAPGRYVMDVMTTGCSWRFTIKLP